MSPKDLAKLKKEIDSTTPDQPNAEYDCPVKLHGEWHNMRFVCRTVWSNAAEPAMTGVIGKLVGNGDENERLHGYRITPHDPLTGLLTYDRAKMFMQQLLDGKPKSRFAAAVIDIDNFKTANEKYGVPFGDDLLMHIAQRIRRSIKETDIACRIGGDEFGVLIECGSSPHDDLNRIFSKLGNTDEMLFPVTVSAGAAVGEISGIDCSTLIARANRALYAAKKGGKAQIRFYDDSMRDMLSALSPIDEIDDERKTTV
jgi:putative two-component system response regulator